MSCPTPLTLYKLHRPKKNQHWTRNQYCDLISDKDLYKQNVQFFAPSPSCWMTTGQPHRRPTRRDPPCIVAQNRVSNFFSGSAMGLNKECQFSWLYFLWHLAFLIVGASKNGKEFDFNLLFRIYKCTYLSTEGFSRGPRNKCFQIPSTLLWILGDVRENNNSRKSGRNNTRLLPVLQTMIQCKDGSLAIFH